MRPRASLCAWAMGCVAVILMYPRMRWSLWVISHNGSPQRICVAQSTSVVSPLCVREAASLLTVAHTLTPQPGDAVQHVCARLHVLLLHVRDTQVGRLVQGVLAQVYVVQHICAAFLLSSVLPACCL